jgi:hypothetical protein
VSSGSTGAPSGDTSRRSQNAPAFRNISSPISLSSTTWGLKILPPKSGEILLEIIMRRYENRSTLMTSNRPIEEWGKLLSDVPAASAILDRLLHHAEVLAITGRSYRLQDSANQRTLPKPKSSPQPQLSK